MAEDYIPKYIRKREAEFIKKEWDSQDYKNKKEEYRGAIAEAEANIDLWRNTLKSIKEEYKLFLAAERNKMNFENDLLSQMMNKTYDIEVENKKEK